MAIRLSQKKKSVLVAIHVLSVASWIGGTLAMLLLTAFLSKGANGEQLLYTMESMKIIDENLLKYPALLSLFTGIMLSVWTQWGLVKHYWVIIKLVLTVLTIMIGILFLSKWTAGLGEIISDMGFLALKDEQFKSTWTSILMTSSFNLFCLGFMTFITYLKPFGKVKRNNQQRG
ncbi:hypothetical protein HHO41_15685 [Bacillus sp. DNRA2]|uniref:hypothetical protein n=1 Tax=Bacillus sp. DNRA2 TaxID=2723053 RepID=UPI00145ED97C|nr:hypothetical protein [Bacillus sp. DNRA2]NMD71741.1 hypothetical protein [Bacillus sp. DNRA2]